MIANLLPAVDPAGIPGPVWLFQFLLVFTFILHLVFMNLALGGSLLAAVAHALSGGRGDDPRGVLARRLVTMNGYGISLTITTGIAPLLFIQVIYHQLFYAATILIGGMWLSLLLFLTVGYYAIYAYKFKGAPARGEGGGFWIWLSAALFLIIGGIQVAVNLIHMQPALWEKLAAHPWSILGDPTFVPRYLHFLFGGILFSAIVVVWWAGRQVRKGDHVEVNKAIASFAWKWMLWSIVIQIITGLWLTFALPQDVLLDMMRGGGVIMGPYSLAILLGLGILIMLFKTNEPTGSSALVSGIFAMVLLELVVMAVTRDQLRSLYLGSSIDLGAFTVKAQWGNFVLFAVLMIAGLATVHVMVRKVLTERAEGPDAA